MTVAAISLYRCDACRRRIPTNAPRVFAGLIVCCVGCLDAPATHRIAFPDCGRDDQDHGAADHGLIWAHSAAAADRMTNHAIATTERQPA
jgi:hypothetical protein